MKGRIVHGAPPPTLRSMPNAVTRSRRFLGPEYPGSKNALAGESTMGRAFDQDGNLIDSPIAGHGQQPDRAGQSKAAQGAAVDPTEGLGVHPGGVLDH